MSNKPNRRQATFEDLMATVERLRGPGGCPWDRQQTHGSLRPYLLEECYELLEVVDAGDADGMADELGDLMTHVAFHADIARRAGTFSIEDVLERVVQKLIRRHPHVFGDARRLDTPREVEDRWEELKRDERGDRLPAPDAVPPALPALAYAAALQRRAAAGARPDPLPAAQALLEAAPEGKAEEVAGDFLFAAVAAFLDGGVDPEAALRAAARRFRDRARGREGPDDPRQAPRH
ncbi:MAG: MazG family protein [Gemmatimonadetes bacterium]|nr:MazG family protein [Gemmatimonadota bacterium]